MNGLKQTIEAHPFFQKMDPKHMEIIAAVASTAQFKIDEILFREGEPANQFYLIQNGRIALEAHEPADGTALVQTVGQGEVLGWSWLFAPFVWHFRARALEPTSAIVLNGAHLLAAAEADHQFGYSLMKRVAQVVIQRLQATRQRLLTEEIDSALKG